MQTQDAALYWYTMLDDSDLLSAIKVWSTLQDTTLHELCLAFTNRRLFKGERINDALSNEQRLGLIKRYMEQFNISEQDAEFFFVEHVSTSNTYSENGESIGIFFKDGSVRDIAEASDMLNMETLTYKPQKRYLFRWE